MTTAHRETSTNIVPSSQTEKVAVNQPSRDIEKRHYYNAECSIFGLQQKGCCSVLFKMGRRSIADPRPLCQWLVEAPSVFNAYKGQRAPASFDYDIPTLYTCPHIDTHHSYTWCTFSFLVWL